MEYGVDEKQIQRDLQRLIDTGGLNKRYAKMAARRATEVVDDVARVGYRNGAYKYGSSKTHLQGNMLTSVNRPIYIARERFRKWAGRRGSIKFAPKKQRKTDFWFRSMVKRTSNGRGNPSTLSHLIEDGARNFRTGKKNVAHQIRRDAFRRKRMEALRVLGKGIELAVLNATKGTKMGLIDFRKRTQA